MLLGILIHRGFANDPFLCWNGRPGSQAMSFLSIQHLLSSNKLGQKSNGNRNIHSKDYTHKIIELEDLEACQSKVSCPAVPIMAVSDVGNNTLQCMFKKKWNSLWLIGFTSKKILDQIHWEDIGHSNIFSLQMTKAESWLIMILKRILSMLLYSLWRLIFCVWEDREWFYKCSTLKGFDEIFAICTSYAPLTFRANKCCV